MSATPDLQTAASVISIARTMVDTATARLAANGGPDKNQTLAYDLAHVAAAVETARSLVDYGAKGDLEARITCAFAADMVHDLISRLIGREQLWGVDPSAMAPAHDFVQKYRDPAFLVSLFDQQGPRHLAQDFEMVQDTFRSPRAPSTCTGTTPTSPRRSSPGSPRSEPSGSACRPSTAGTARAARASTWPP
jgi:(2S)-methylsuccinyl-CoA dehydrogenase